MERYPIASFTPRAATQRSSPPRCENSAFKNLTEFGSKSAVIDRYRSESAIDDKGGWVAITSSAALTDSSDILRPPRRVN